MQLCRQVERALVLALADERREAVLASVALDAVEPAPDASRLKVTVRVPVSPGDRAALGEARAALSRRRAHLREEVARSVHRKRAPELTFEVWPAEDGGE